MKIHKRLIDLESPAEVVKQIVRSLSLLVLEMRGAVSVELTLFTCVQTSMSIEAGVEVEVTVRFPLKLLPATCAVLITPSFVLSLDCRLIACMSQRCFSYLILHKLSCVTWSRGELHFLGQFLENETSFTVIHSRANRQTLSYSVCCYSPFLAASAGCPNFSIALPPQTSVVAV